MVIHWKYGAKRGQETYEARKQLGIGDRSPDSRPAQDRSRNPARCQTGRKAADCRAGESLRTAKEVRGCSGIGAQAIWEGVPEISRLSFGTNGLDAGTPGCRWSGIGRSYTASDVRRRIPAYHDIADVPGPCG